MRVLVSGYAQQVPRFLILVLRKTLRHVPPPSRSAELVAARRVAKLGLGRSGKFARTLQNLSSIERTTPTAMQREISSFFDSVTGASLLLTGAIASEDAESVSLAVRNELKPLLRLDRPLAPDWENPLAELRIMRAEEELQTWEGLLYKPVFSSQVAQNVCFDPAIARALDLCGGL
jgi:hypothetical protein